MRPEPSIRSEPEEAGPADPRWALVQRTTASAALARSRRLQELLRFVCSREILGAPAATEAEVAIAVFGRPPSFDPSEDTLVRVQASQLRRRLALYFATEGVREPTTIELGHGTYGAIFRPRAASEAASSAASAAAEPARRPSAAVLALGALSVALAIACVVLLVRNRELRARVSPDGPRPAVGRLWRQMFANGRPLYVVLGDSSLTTFQDLVGQQLSPTHYQEQQFTSLRERLTDPVAQQIAAQLVKQRYTSLADAKLLAGAVQLNVASGLRAEIVLARDAGPQLFRSNNVVLAGPRRSNPWVELFEERLSFRSHGQFDQSKRAFAFVDAAPRPGEPTEFVVKWGTTGFCRVAYLPNLDRNGSVLLVTGADMSSGEAGAAFVGSEPWIRTLRDRLGVAADAPLPHFEAVLRTHLVASSISSLELVAARAVAP